MRRRLPCDVPGCTHERAQRWQRLCSSCFAMLPRTIRDGLAAAHRMRSEKDKKSWKRLAREHLDRLNGGTPQASAAPRVAPGDAYRNTARLLGEHEEEATE